MTNGIDRAKNDEKSEKKEKSTLEKEENNNKKSKRPLEEEVENESRKKAATIEPPKQIFEIPPFGGNSDLSGIPKSVTATSKLEAVASPTFTFPLTRLFSHDCSECPLFLPGPPSSLPASPLHAAEKYLIGCEDDFTSERGADDA